MNKKTHNRIHSLVPIYASLSRICKESVDGWKDGKIDRFVDIRKEAEDGMAQLLVIENQILKEEKL